LATDWFLGNIISSGVGAPTSLNKGSGGHFASTYIFQFGVGIRSGKNDDFSFKSATKMRSQMVYELNEKTFSIKS